MHTNIVVKDGSRFMKEVSIWKADVPSLSCKDAQGLEIYCSWGKVQ